MATMPTPAKALVTCVIMVLAIGMLGALGQIVVHDIIPTFYSQSATDNTVSPSGDRHAGMNHSAPTPSGADRGDLFAVVFAYVSLRALWEMWFKPRH